MYVCMHACVHYVVIYVFTGSTLVYEDITLRMRWPEYTHFYGVGVYSAICTWEFPKIGDPNIVP